MTKKPRTAAGTKSERKPRQAPQGRTRAKKAETAAQSPDQAIQPNVAPRTRANSKQAQLIEMLRQPDGATVTEIVAAFKWQPHTVRGAIAGALKKKLGLMRRRM